MVAKRKSLLPTEHEEQVALIEFSKLCALHDDRWALLFAIPNGGVRHWKTASRLKAEGVKAGILDLCLPEPVDDYHGLWIEMKRKGNTTTPEQDWWIEKLRARSFYVEVCFNWIEAATVIAVYLRDGKAMEIINRYKVNR